MEHSFKGLIAGLAMLAGAQPALAEDPATAPAEFELVSTTGDCGGATLEAARGGGFSVKFPGFAAESDETTPRARKLCYMQIKVKGPESFRVLRSSFEVSGSATIAPGARRSNVSVRYFAPGDMGDAYYKVLYPGAGTRGFTGVSEGTPRWSRCGKEALLSLLVDVTAHSAARDPTRASSVKITEINVPALRYRRCTPPSQPGE